MMRNRKIEGTFVCGPLLLFEWMEYFNLGWTDFRLVYERLFKV